MSNAKSASAATKTQRSQVAEAVLQGYLDSTIAADLSTAKTNGFIPNQRTESELGDVAIAGINR